MIVYLLIFCFILLILRKDENFSSQIIKYKDKEIYKGYYNCKEYSNVILN